MAPLGATRSLVGSAHAVAVVVVAVLAAMLVIAGPTQSRAPATRPATPLPASQPCRAVPGSHPAYDVGLRARASCARATQLWRNAQQLERDPLR